MSDDSGQKHDKVLHCLKKWVESAGGNVNPNLQLRQRSTPKSTIRGIFAAKPIEKGDLLVRLPNELAVSGEKLPKKFNDRIASPWLRCLASLYLIQGDPAWDAYVKSLPMEYETLWRWSNEDLRFLDGSTIGDIARTERNEGTAKTRHEEYVKPYLTYLKVPEKGNTWEVFQQMSMCLSTRGFHLQASNEDTMENNDEKQSNKKEATKSHGSRNVDGTAGPYLGPFLLPMIDLLNHSNKDKATTLQRDSITGDFFMVAERELSAGEEVTHSYGNLNASQMLQTFGFVPDLAIRESISEGVEDSIDKKTPAILSKKDLLDCCHTVRQSTYPSNLAASMEQNEIEGDVWDLESPEGRDSSFLPDQFLIALSSSTGSYLSDDIVTFCCIQFLPQDVFKEIFSDGDDGKLRLDRSALEDYYLGKLIVMAIMTAIKRKLADYKTLPTIPGAGETILDDKESLEHLLKLELHTPSMLRAMYGITIRLEEKQTLEKLRNEVIEILSRLDDDEDDEDANDSISQPAKKARAE